MSTSFKKDDRIDKVFIFPSSSSNREYRTIVWGDGKVTCDCPGWCKRVDREGGRQCKHTLEAGRLTMAEDRRVLAEDKAMPPQWRPGQQFGEFAKELAAYNKGLSEREQREQRKAAERVGLQEQEVLAGMLSKLEKAERQFQNSRAEYLAEGLLKKVERDMKRYEPLQKPKPIAVKPTVTERVRRKFEL